MELVTLTCHFYVYGKYGFAVVTVAEPICWSYQHLYSTRRAEIERVVTMPRFTLALLLRKPRAQLLAVQLIPRRYIQSQPAYEGHIPLNLVENAFLAVGSAVASLANPRRGGKPVPLHVQT